MGMTVRLWNPDMGEQLEVFRRDAKVCPLRFSSGNQCLGADRGLLRLHPRLVTAQSVVPKSAADIFTRRLTEEG